MKIPGKGTTIGGETYRSLREGILSGDIPPGDRVRTQKLCVRFGVSLGAVREALSQLMAEGLVLSEAHRGYTVAPISIGDLKDLTRVRIETENLCLTWSIEAGGLEWEAEVIGATHRLTNTYGSDGRSPASTDWITAHETYHCALVSACASPRLLQIRRQLYDQSERYRKLESALVRDRDAIVEHRQIADAAVARKIPLATRLMREHIALTTENIIRAMQDRDGKPSAPRPRSGRARAGNVRTARRKRPSARSA